MQKAGLTLCLLSAEIKRLTVLDANVMLPNAQAPSGHFWDMHCKTTSCQGYGRCCRGTCRGTVSPWPCLPTLAPQQPVSGEACLSGSARVVGSRHLEFRQPIPLLNPVKTTIEEPRKIWCLSVSSALKTSCDEGTTTSLRKLFSCLTIQILIKLFLAPIFTSYLLQIKLITSCPIPSGHRTINHCLLKTSF